MRPTTSNEHQALLRALKDQREHIFEALQGLTIDDLRRQVLPSRWTYLGLVNHLSRDVERFWFRAVIAGDQRMLLPPHTEGQSGGHLPPRPGIVLRDRRGHRRDERLCVPQGIRYWRRLSLPLAFLGVAVPCWPPNGDELML